MHEYTIFVYFHFISYQEVLFERLPTHLCIIHIENLVNPRFYKGVLGVVWGEYPYSRVLGNIFPNPHSLALKTKEL